MAALIRHEASFESSEEEEIDDAHAAALIYDAMEGEERSLPQHSNAALTAHRLLARFLPLLRLWSFLGLFIEFFAEPHWCYYRGGCPDNEYFSTLPKFRVSSALFLSVNFVYIFPFVVDVAFHLIAYRQRFWTPRQTSYLLLVAIYLFVTLLAFAKARTFDILAFIRPMIFIILNHRVRKQVVIVVRSLRPVIELFILGLLLLFFFALVAIILFPVGTIEGDTFFPSLPDGMWSLMVLLTTANFPDVMLPAFERSRAAVFFFLTFIMVGMFFLVNVLTAIVFNAYQQQMDEDDSSTKEQRQKKLYRAYNLLTDGKVLSVKRMDFVLKDVRGFLNIHNLDGASLDLDKDSTVSASEFNSIISALTTARDTQSQPVLERCYPALLNSIRWQRLKSFAESDWPGFIIDLLLFLNLSSIIMHMWPEIVGSATPQEAHIDREVAITGLLQTAFTCLMLLEAVVKILTMGFSRYLSVHINQFDFAITLVVTALSLLLWIPLCPFSSPQLARIAQCFRLFRFCRLLDRYHPYHELGRLTFVLLPAALDVFMLLTLMCYTFAILGVLLFGGVTSQDPSAPSYAAVAKSSYGRANYYVNNFNDVGMGMVLVFELLVVNNWFVISDGYAAACGWAARSFFVIIWALGVLVGLNLLLSIIIGAFVMEYRVDQSDQKGLRLPDFAPDSEASDAI